MSEEKAALEIAGYRFRDEQLLATALTHTSYAVEHRGDTDATEDFERLEFLGDAVISVVVAEELYRRFPNATEGKLTTSRAALVWRDALAELGRSLGLPDRARLGRGAEESGGRTRTGLAASLFESFVGAVYVDGGFDRARKVVLQTMQGAFQRIEDSPPVSTKNLLQQWAHSAHVPLPTYHVVEETGPLHEKSFIVEVRLGDNVAKGTGSSKREAEEDAAGKLLGMLKH